MKTMLPPQALPLLVILALSVAACGDVAPPPGTDRIGDTLVVHSEGPVHEEPVLLRPVQTYGQFSGDPRLEFNYVTTFDVEANGDVIVYDLEGEIKRVRRDGSFGSVIARPGQGPGEVSYAFGVRADPEGGVYALDLGNGRLARYGPEGGFESARVVSRPPRYGEDALQIGPGGEIWMGYHPPHTDEPTGFPRAAYLGFDWELGLVDTVRVPATYAADCPLRSSAQHRRGFWEDVREPFNPKTKWARGEDGRLAFGCPAEYRFDVVEPDGGVRRISRKWEPIVVDDEGGDFMAPFAGPIQATRPAYARILLPTDGRIWVWPEQPLESVELDEEARARFGMDRRWQISTQGAFDVFEADGTWLGTVEVPANVRYSAYPTAPPVVIRGDSVWAVTFDDLGVSYVTKHVVDWP